MIKKSILKVRGEQTRKYIFSDICLFNVRQKFIFFRVPEYEDEHNPMMWLPFQRQNEKFDFFDVNGD